MDRVLVTILTVGLLAGTVSGVSIIGPEDALIEGESSANLTCVGSDPIDTVEWRKDDRVLNSSDRIEFSENKTSVLISSVLRTDSGEYSCILNNNNSEAANYTLTVNYGPDVRILGEGNVEEGSVILLFCSVMSVPAASVTWTVDGSTVGNSPLLFIENSTNTHSGEYTCTAYNSVTGNTASDMLSLLVTEKAKSSGLGPGAAAGITAAAMVVLAVLIVGLYFLIIHLKKSPCPLHKPNTERNKQNRTPSISFKVEEEDEQKETAFKEPVTHMRNAPRAQNEKLDQHLYENCEKPPVPRRAKPPLPEWNVDISSQLHPDPGAKPKLPKRPDLPDADLLKRQGSLQRDRPSLHRHPDHIFKTDSDVYSTHLP